MNVRKIYPPEYLLISIIIMLVLHYVFPLIHIVPQQWNLFGFLFIVIGIILNFKAVVTFHAAHTPVTPFSEASTLVVHGVYKISRNPIYLGFVWVLLGFAFLLGSLSPFIMVPAYAYWIEKKFIEDEEAMLAKRFGKKWIDYSKQTRRWL